MEQQKPVPGLLPCPHCGKSAEMRRVADQIEQYRIVCACGWRIEIAAPLAIAVETWNRRAPMPEARGESAANDGTTGPVEPMR
jgi:Lar family restriction alleviation protein